MDARALHGLVAGRDGRDLPGRGPEPVEERLAFARARRLVRQRVGSDHRDVGVGHGLAGVVDDTHGERERRPQREHEIAAALTEQHTRRGTRARLAVGQEPGLTLDETAELELALGVRALLAGELHLAAARDAEGAHHRGLERAPLLVDEPEAAAAIADRRPAHLHE